MLCELFQKDVKKNVSSPQIWNQQQTEVDFSKHWLRRLETL